MPQWFIFASIIVTVYGWVEKKKPFRIIGMLVLIALGLFAIWAIYQGYFLSYKYLTPEELYNEEIEGELVEEVPFEGMLLPAYWSFVVSAVIAIPAAILEWKNKKTGRLLMILASLVALFGFFVIVDAMKLL
jgi:phosphoglycerol transferase MdoB-like AlkP superfamily enzyme